MTVTSPPSNVGLACPMVFQTVTWSSRFPHWKIIKTTPTVFLRPLCLKLLRQRLTLMKYLRHRLATAKNTFADVIWYFLIGVLLLSSIILIYLIYLSYFKYHINLAHGPDSSDIGMNLLAVVYFLGNTLIAIIAAFSITFARSQLKLAEQSRRASIYMELYPVHVTTRKSFGLMTRKLSVTKSRHLRQFLGILSRKKSSVWRPRIVRMWRSICCA